MWTTKQIEKFHNEAVEAREMLRQTLTMAFPFWKRQYPQVALEIEGTRVVLIDYKKGNKVIWKNRPNDFFQQIRSLGFFQ